jgi:hypothetical protein
VSVNAVVKEEVEGDGGGGDEMKLGVEDKQG